jgi:hypothetical protein
MPIELNLSNRFGSLFCLPPCRQFFSTDRGAKIGDSEARIKGLYKGKYKVLRHEYVDTGHYPKLNLRGKPIAEPSSRRARRRNSKATSSCLIGGVDPPWFGTN